MDDDLRVWTRALRQAQQRPSDHRVPRMHQTAPTPLSDPMATSETPRVILFVSLPGTTEDARRLRALRVGLERHEINHIVVNRMSTRLSDLLLVAQHRILEAPFWVAVNADGDTLARFRGVPTLRELRAALAQVTELCP